MVFHCLGHQEFFQGLESHMILTEMYFSKSIALPKERQALEETLAEAQSVLKDAHSKGVELEFILEVRLKPLFIDLHFVSLYNMLKVPQQQHSRFLLLLRLGAVWCRTTRACTTI